MGTVRRLNLPATVERYFQAIRLLSLSRDRCILDLEPKSVHLSVIVHYDGTTNDNY
jgi:hypothetical protein